jgi:thiol-disulfide isomerase/thioredoxin
MKGLSALIVVVVVVPVVLCVGCGKKAIEEPKPVAPAAGKPVPAPVSEKNPNVGKVAPELQVKEWIAGGAVSDAELKGKPYVVEFWATWCPPCRMSIPHLNELSLRVQPFGLAVIGLSNEEAGVVRPFVDKMNMRYHVGIDNDTKGFEFPGIPFAAVVGMNGKVAWAGHPLHPGFEEALFKALSEFRPKLEPAMALARAGKLGQAHAELGRLGTPEAKTAQEALAADAAAQWERCARETGYAQYKLVALVAETYAGLPEAAEATAKLPVLKKEPAVAKALAEEEVSEELEKQINALGKIAEAKQRAKVPDPEVRKEFYTAIVSLFTDFVTKYPEHPRTPSLKKDVDAMTGELAKLNAPAAGPPAPPLPVNP